MSMPNLPKLADQLSADPNSKSSSSSSNNNDKDVHFVSRSNPERLGNTAAIAFGGCVGAVVVHAAYQTIPRNVDPPYHLYSVLGTFHGPTKTDRKLNCTVTPTRNTKTFATRRVVASQTQDDGTERTCADLFIDFHVEEPALLEFNAQPSLPIWLKDGPFHPERTLDTEEIVSNLLRNGHVTEPQVNAYRRMFHLSNHFLEVRHCTTGVSATNLFGLAARLPTPQDHLSLPEKSTGEWIKTRESFDSEDLNMAALAFFMDQALSFVPLNHDHKGFMDAGACSTLEFALRVFTPRIKMGEWNLRERRAIQGGWGRTMDEGRLWNQNGELLCSMTQACILRPPSKKVASAVEGKSRGKAKM